MVRCGGWERGWSKGARCPVDSAGVSFDDLVGAGEDRGRYGEAEGVGSLQI